ncbi:hypothetical protein OUZ56_027074 [Daphnia magna]|uniref:Uncharacterized protein n=1 Tax=Daphnia magna TaxID=35525 RepID=A0ABQ9ZNP2_9CRUS|nr:hypothetical protein OUZ56_027074 [Daphnia magna]
MSDPGSLFAKVGRLGGFDGQTGANLRDTSFHDYLHGTLDCCLKVDCHQTSFEWYALISSLTMCFINTSTPEIVGNCVFVLHLYYPHAIFTLLYYIHGKPGVILYHPGKRILEIDDF